MNTIIRNIATLFIGIVVWICLSQETLAQCKSDPGDPVKGEFSINGGKVNVKSDGGGSPTAANNIPIKICEGELITLKNTLPVNSVASNSYWITELNSYNARTTYMSSSTGSIDASYSTINGKVDLRLISKSVNPSGISFYNGPGKYVITQYDNSSSVAGGPGFHHACQVIEVIAPPKPVVTTSVCSGNEVQITFPASPNNIFDDYEITFKATVGSYNPVLKTGKPTSYPFTVKSGTLLPDGQDRIITVKGLSVTGNCLAPTETLGKISINAGRLNKPIINSIAGTTNKGEFKLVISSQTKISRNVYMRDPKTANVYDYTKIFKTYASTATPTDDVVLQVPDGDKIFCFQAESLDAACPSTASNANLRSPEEICTTPINVKPESNKNVISWLQAPSGLIGSVFKNYRVERLNIDGTIEKLLQTISTIAELSVEDKDVICGKEYTYRVRTNYGATSDSQIIKVKAISDVIPSKIPIFFATMTNDAKFASIQGQFDPTNIPVNIKLNSYKFYRADALNADYTLIKTGNLQINDSTTEVDKKSYCYYMTWTNLCEKESVPSEKVCTINLQASGSVVNWTKETPISGGTDSYIVQRVNPINGTNIKELASNLKNIYSYNTQTLPETEGQEIYIQIEARPVGWNILGSSFLPRPVSNIIRIFRPSLTMSPQIFTPNGDSQNDKFIVRGKFIKKLKMFIYDRWGNVIFYDEMDGYPIENNQNESTVVGWDGMMNNGNKAIEGNYVFKIEVEDTIGQITTKEGTLLLAY